MSTGPLTAPPPCCPVADPLPGDPGLTEPNKRERKTTPQPHFSWGRLLVFLLGLPGLTMGATVILSAFDDRVFEFPVTRVIVFLGGLAIFLVGFVFSGSAIGLIGKRNPKALLTLIGLLWWFLVHWAAIYGVTRIGLSGGRSFVQTGTPYLLYLGLAVLDAIVIYMLADKWWGPRLPSWAAVSETEPNKNRRKLIVFGLLIFMVLVGADKLGLFGNRIT